MDWYLMKVSYYRYHSYDERPVLLTELRLVNAASRLQASQKMLEHLGVTESMVDDIECLNVE